MKSILTILLFTVLLVLISCDKNDYPCETGEWIQDAVYTPKNMPRIPFCGCDGVTYPTHNSSIQYNADGSKMELHGKTIVLSLGNLIFQEILDLVLTI